MYTKRAELKAGLVVLAGLAALLFLLYVAGGKKLFREWRTWRVRFEQGDTAPGRGDAVHYLGLEIGHVGSVSQQSELRTGDRLTEADKELLKTMPPGTPPEVREIYVLADLELPAAQTFPRGTWARLSKSLVTGSAILDIQPGISREDLPAEETMKTPMEGRQGLTLDDIAKKVNALVEGVQAAAGDVSEILEQAKGLVTDLRAKVADLDIATINDNVVETTAMIRQVISAAGPEIERIASNIDAASTDFQRLAKDGAAAVAQARIDLEVLMTSLKSAAATVDKVVTDAAPRVESFVASLDGLSKRMSALADDLVGVGPEARGVLARFGTDVDLIMASLKDTAHNILDASEDIRAHPWLLTNKPEQDQIAFENLLGAMRNYLRAMREMTEAAARIQSVLARPDPGAPGLREQLESALSDFRASQERARAAETRFQELLQKAAPKAGR